MTQLRRISHDDGIAVYELVVTNDHRRRVDFEAELVVDNAQSRTRLVERNGRRIWRTRLPANGRAVLRFTVSDS
jgi:hypothetical protein